MSQRRQDFFDFELLGSNSPGVQTGRYERFAAIGDCATRRRTVFQRLPQLPSAVRRGVPPYGGSRLTTRSQARKSPSIRYALPPSPWSAANPASVRRRVLPRHTAPASPKPTTILFQSPDTLRPSGPAGILAAAGAGAYRSCPTAIPFRTTPDCSDPPHSTRGTVLFPAALGALIVPPTIANASGLLPTLETSLARPEPTRVRLVAPVRFHLAAAHTSAQSPGPVPRSQAQSSLLGLPPTRGAFPPIRC